MQENAGWQRIALGCFHESLTERIVAEEGEDGHPKV